MSNKHFKGLHINNNFKEPNSTNLSRRDLIKGTGSAFLVSGLSACSNPEQASINKSLTNPLYYSSVGALSTAIQSGDLTSEEIVTTFLDRINEVNPFLNAVVQLDAEAAVNKARAADAASLRGESWGALHGIPMTIKDSFDTTGLISTGGTLGRATFIPQQDATVVKRLRDAGAILLGKTNTPELTLNFETNNLIYGQTNNPYNLDRTPGGSSGGAAAIIAAGGSPFDIGSDYGGSIRLPAHFCGIAGIKPSAGRVPRTGHIFPFGGIQDSYQQIGPLARYVDDLILLLPLIMGPDFIDPGVVSQPYSDPNSIDLNSLRVSFHTDNGVQTPDPEIIQTVETVSRLLESEVMLVEEKKPIGIERVMDIGFGLPNWDGGEGVRRILEVSGTTEHTLQFFTEATALTTEQLDQLLVQWFDWRSEMLSFMNDYDVIISPVNAHPAVLHGATNITESLAAFSYTMTYNSTGWPGAVVRAGTSSEGLPIGVQIITRPGREDIALAVAKFIETGLGGYQEPVL
jgi:amidase